MCKLPRLRSACLSMQSDQGLSKFAFKVIGYTVRGSNSAIFISIHLFGRVSLPWLGHRISKKLFPFVKMARKKINQKKKRRDRGVFIHLKDFPESVDS